MVEDEPCLGVDESSLEHQLFQECLVEGLCAHQDDFFLTESKLFAQRVAVELSGESLLDCGTADEHSRRRKAVVDEAVPKRLVRHHERLQGASCPRRVVVIVHEDADLQGVDAAERTQHSERAHVSRTGDRQKVGAGTFDCAEQVLVLSAAADRHAESTQQPLGATAQCVARDGAEHLADRHDVGFRAFVAQQLRHRLECRLSG